MLFFKRLVVIFASVCSIVACSAAAFAENETECASSLHFSQGAAPISVDAQSDPLSPPDLVSNRDDTSDAAGSGAADLRANLVECAVASNDAPSSVELTAPPGPRTLKRASEVRNWLLTGFVSKHFSQDSQLEDYNAGVFFEHDFDRRWGAIVGEYRNSGNIQSRVLAALWQPLRSGPFSVGLLAGALNGYVQLNHGHDAAAALPFFSVATHRFIAKLICVPPVIKTAAAVCSLQAGVNLGDW